jgi:hypothetical protein
MGLTCYGGVRLACIIASLIRSDIQSFASYHEPTKTFIVIPALLASIPVGFITGNLLVCAVRPLRRFFDQEAKRRKGEGFSKATGGLLKFSMYWVPPFVAVSLGAALFGK